MLFLSGEDLKEVLRPEIAVNAVKKAFIALYEKKIVQVPRQVLYVNNNWWGFMTSYTEKYLVTKIVNVIEANKSKGLPAVQGIVVLLDAENGKPLALMDGTVLTAIRTSAASILSTEVALGGKRRIGVLGIIGAGLEAEYHSIMAQEYFKVNKLLITARKNHYKLAQKVGGEAVDLEKLLRESDVIFATTSSTTPVVLGKLLKEDFHVVSIGAHTPESREIDDETIIRSKTYFVDSLDAVSRETGDYIEPFKKGILKKVLEIGEILSRNLKVERPSIFKTVGVPSEDNFAAHFAYEEAVRRNLGVNLTS